MTSSPSGVVSDGDRSRDSTRLRLILDVAFVALSLAIFAWVAWDAVSFRIITGSPGADYWEHTAVLRALLENPFHPRHPFIASDIGSPRFGPHFVLIALVGRALGVDALGAMSISSIVNTALFLVGIRLFYAEYFRNPWAPLLGLVVSFGSWLDAPHFSNVYKLSIFFSVAGYPSTAALGVMLLGLTVTLRLLRAASERPSLWVLVTFLWAYEYITHPLTAMLAFTAAALLCLVEPSVPRRRRFWVGGSILAGVLLASLWPYYPALGMVASGTVARVEQGIEAGGHELHSFYQPGMIANVLGFALLSLLPLPYFVWKRKHLLVPLGALTMLGVFAVSAYLDVPLGHRFLLLSVFFFQIGLVWLLLELLPPHATKSGAPPLLRVASVAGAVVAGGLLLYMGVTSVTDARERFLEAGRTQGGESVTVRYGRRIGELAGPKAIVFGDPLSSWPIPTFGPRVVTLHHRNPLISDAEERNRSAAIFFSGRTKDDERAAILERYRVTHVVLPLNPSKSAQRFLEARGHRRGLPTGRMLYDVRSR